MKIRILHPGKIKTAHLKDGVSSFVKRIAPYADIELIETKDVTPSKTFIIPKCIDEEGNSLLKAIKDGYVVALDEKGVHKTSQEFSDFLGKFRDSGETINFIIGGAYGLSDAVKARADILLSFSKMTFTHEMVRLFLVEQIYRGLCIMLGKEYHNDR